MKIVFNNKNIHQSSGVVKEKVGDLLKRDCIHEIEKR
jgi:hypothetical protein